MMRTAGNDADGRRWSLRVRLDDRSQEGLRVGGLDAEDHDDGVVERVQVDRHLARTDDGHTPPQDRGVRQLAAGAVRAATGRRLEELAAHLDPIEVEDQRVADQRGTVADLPAGQRLHDVGASDVDRHRAAEGLVGWIREQPIWSAYLERSRAF